ncbi:MAG: hypothetical protein ABII96_03205 [Candidatus Zixiibacteriota bacterium]
MKLIIKYLPLFFVMFILYGCSRKVMQPVQSGWESVPCEYRFEGGNESILSVRAPVVEFDSAKIVAQIFQWTVLGDTLTQQATFYPFEYQISDGYTTFTTERCLPVNSVLRSVELLIKRQKKGE